MQKIAFTIFEIAKNAFHQGLPQDQCLQLIEHHVKKTYLDCIAELKDKNLIDEGLMEQAASQSNIDAMAQQQAEVMPEESAQETPQGGIPQPQQGGIPQPQQGGVPQPQQNPNAPLPATAKVLKLATLAMLFRKIQQEKVQTILNKFSTDDAQTVIKFMGMPDLDQKVDTRIALKCLQEIKTNLPAPNKNLTPSKLIAKIQNVSQYFDKSQLELKLRTERLNVRKFVFTALEGEYFEMPPKVANIIATHLEDSV